MGVVVSVDDVGPCRKELTIEVPAPAVQAELERVTREFSREVRLPGFRRGKVPAKVVRKRFRREIDQEVLERLVPRYWRQAEAEESLDALMAPTVGDVELEDGAPLKFKATVEVRPEIRLSPDLDFDLPPAEVRVGDAEVDEVIDQLRQRVAPWKPVDREAARGDRVLLRLQEVGAETESDDEDGEGDEVHVEVGDPRVWEELTLAVTGMKAGQTNTFTRQEPAPESSEGEEPAPAPPPREFRFEVLEVAEKDLPELDDELAKTVGDAESVADLRDKVEKSLLREKTEQRRNERQQALIDQLIERNPVTVPEGVVEQEARAMIEDYARSLAQRGIDPNAAGVDWGAMASNIRPSAQKRVHARLLLDALAEEQDVEVTEEELEATIRTIARAEGSSALAVRRKLDEDGRLGLLKSQLRRDKIVSKLLGEEPEEGAGDGSDADDESE